MDKLALSIAGEITLSENSGSSLKKWREIFGVTQTELAEYLHVTPSTISDYEASRRRSPGISVIKRFVNAIIEIDRQKGGWVAKKFRTKAETEAYQVIDLPKHMTTYDFCKNIEANIITNKGVVKKTRVYSATIVDSMKAILELPASEFIKIYGSTTERALIFTDVTMGRSPMVAIRVTELKPSVVVLHNVAEVDKIAKKISEVEKVPIATTLLPLDEVKKRITSIH